MHLEIWLIASAVTVSLSSYVAVELVRRYAVQQGFYDTPTARSSHLYPVPSGGGLVLVALNLLGWIAITRVGPAIFGYAPVTTVHTAVFVVGGLMIAAVSFVDDLGHVPYPIRMVIHAAAAILFISFYTYWHAFALPLVGTFALGLFGIALSLLWIVGLTNAYNFIDGLDGLAAGQAVAAGLGWAALGLATGQLLIAGAGVVLAASSLGFLVHNWHPARIFMGDVGSTFLGYSFAVLPLVAARYDTRLALAGVLLVWPAVFDSTFTVLARLSRGENIFAGHREFLFHRLVRAGWSHTSASLLYITLPLLGAGLAFTWQYGDRFAHACVAVGLVSLCVSLVLLVRYEERKYETRTRLRIVAGLQAEAASDVSVAEPSALSG